MHVKLEGATALRGHERASSELQGRNELLSFLNHRIHQATKTAHKRPVTRFVAELPKIVRLLLKSTHRQDLGVIVYTPALCDFQTFGNYKDARQASDSKLFDL